MVAVVAVLEPVIVLREARKTFICPAIGKYKANTGELCKGTFVDGD